MKKIFKFTTWFFVVVLVIGACIGGYFWYIWSSNLPYIGSLKEYRPSLITEVFSEDGEAIGRFWEEKRIVVALEDVPPHLIQAFVAAEDARFFEHEGVDFLGIIRAFFKNLAAGKIEQGGSTITQQVTRSLLLKNTKRTYRRKAREALLSMQIEKAFSKERILFLYLNQIYLGKGAYGVEAAARTYFNKPAKDLVVAESALLAGLPQAPSRYSPVLHFDRAKARQKYVLARMAEEGYITREQFIDALETRINIQSAQEDTFKKASYFTEYVRKYLLDKYGRELLYRGGLKVYTTLNLKMQNAAREAVIKGLFELDKREGYRGPERHLAAEDVPDFKSQAIKEFFSSPPEIGAIVQGLVEEVSDERKEVLVRLGEHLALLPLSGLKWARKPDPQVAYYSTSVKKPSQVLEKGDVILVHIIKEIDKPPDATKTQKRADLAWEVSLEQIPEVQGALLSIIPGTGEVKAMVGGRDFGISQFDRATQSRRQPGSAFKPVIYAAAIDWGMSPAEILMDAPYISEQTPDEEAWKPKNYKDKFFGPTLFRTALAKSRNVITVKILRKIGVEYAIDYAKRMGINSPLSSDLSLALGSSGISLMELTRTYSVFANGGQLVEPIFIRRVVDRSGQTIDENQPESVEAISKETAYVMTDLLKAVIQEGTGWRIKALQRPAAGKTGTTNDLRDAWFMGYTPELVTGVWVGYDDQRSMGKGETGSRAASPLWLYFMSQALEGRPVIDFDVPDGVVFSKIDTATGLLAGPYSEKTVLQAFHEGAEPTEYSPKPKSAKSGQFFQFDMDHGS